MRIVYDLRYAADHFTGIGTHAYSLLEALLELPGDERYDVLWNPALAQTRFDLAPLRRHPRVTWHERSLHPLSFADLWRLGSWLRARRPDVYFSPFHLLPFRAGCPAVLTLHDIRPLRLGGGLRWWQRRVFHLTLWRALQARFIVAVSDFSRREIEQSLKTRPGLVRTVHNGVRAVPEGLPLRRPEGLPERPFALVVGDNRPHKNLELLARLWAGDGQMPPLLLVSVGPNDPRYPSLGRLAERAGARDVVSLGWRRPDELEWLYARAAVVLCPSRYEGFGFPLVEGMRHGRPIVASDIPTLREVGGEVARYADADDVRGWREAIDVALAAPERDPARIASGLARSAEFTYRRTAEKTRTLIFEAAGQAAAAAIAPAAACAPGARAPVPGSGAPPAASVAIEIEAPAMRVCYDLRFAEDYFTGIGTHAFNLLESLLALPGGERYDVLWNPALANTRFDFGPVRRNPRVHWIERPLEPFSVPSLWRLGGLLRALRPSVYLSPFYFLPFHAGCPCVLTLHDVWPLRWPGGLKLLPHTLYQLAMARTTMARFVVTSSAFSKREILELSGVEEDHVRVVRLGVPPSRARVAPERPASLPEGSFALAVGINKPHKNYDTLASAWGLLGARPPMRLVVAGPEDARQPGIRTLAARHGASATISGLGRVSEAELAWLYAHASLVLFPSLYEGFGLPMVEAFERGAPVVASDIPPLREVGEGVARFVEPKSAAEWASAVREMASSPERLALMRAAALARAAEFTYERTARATLEVLYDALRPEEAA